MDEQSLAITCSPVEASFLAGLLGATSLVGLADPFQGWLADEIEAAWADARAALADRHFIAVQGDGRIIMDIGVAALIATWAFADVSFLLTCTTVEGPVEECHFHVRQRQAVEQRMTTEGAIRLVPFEDVAAVYRQIAERLRLRDQSAATGTRASLPEAALARARAIAAERGAEAASTVLRQAYLPIATADALAEALATPSLNGALAALARHGTGWDVAGIGVLEGPSGLWRLRAFSQEGENWVEVVPCDAEGARAELRRVFNRVLPEPLVLNKE